MRKPIVAGNWKMNGSSRFTIEMAEQVNTLAKSNSNVDVVISPPSVFIAQMQQLAESFSCAAQNVHFEQSGAYTGEISLEMLKDIKCQYVLVGHSERREMFNETDAVIAKKVNAVIEAGLMPVLCIGETLEQRKSGKANEIVKAQLLSALQGIDFKSNQDTLVVAYEPIWAIGTGETATPEQAQQMHAYIRSVLAEQISAEMSQRTRILYGGSVSAATAPLLFSQEDIDGGLVGGASLKIEDFNIICSSAANK